MDTEVVKQHGELLNCRYLRIVLKESYNTTTKILGAINLLLNVASNFPVTRATFGLQIRQKENRTNLHSHCRDHCTILINKFPGAFAEIKSS